MSFDSWYLKSIREAQERYRQEEDDERQSKLTKEQADIIDDVLTEYELSLQAQDTDYDNEWIEI